MPDAGGQAGPGRARSVLLVPYLYPPSRVVGVHRPAAMAKYLRRLGIQVTVLTTAAHGIDPAEGRGVEVVRTGDLRRVRARLHGRSHVEGIYGSDTYPVKRHPLSYLTVPDRMIVGWVPFALPAALSLHRERRFDAVVTSSPPESTHLVGRALAAAGCAWIADLEDGWTFEAWRSFPTALQQRADGWLERRLLRSADVVTCATQPVAEDLRARVGATTMLVPHGFDPDLIAATNGDAEVAAEMLDPERVSVVYTGRIGAYGRDLIPLLDALRELSADEPEVAGRLEIVIAGPMRYQDRRLLEVDLSPLRISVLGGPLAPASARPPARCRRPAPVRIEPIPRRQPEAVRVPRRGEADPRARRGHGGRPDRGRERRRDDSGRRPVGDQGGVPPCRAR